MKSFKDFRDGLVDFYFVHYKKMLFIPLILLIVAISLLFVKFQTTGDFINRDISLKGGISLTVIEENFDMNSIESLMQKQLPENEVSIRLLRSTGRTIGFIVESDIQDLSTEHFENIISAISKELGKELTNDDYSLETMGSSLGKSFFLQTMNALIIAFIFMGLVVFLYFRSFVPSLAVIFSAFSDIVTTVAVMNLLGFKFSTAGIAALLMLIGYSIDTDIMLTTRVLKRKDQSLKEAVRGAFKTGLTMTITTMAAVTVALLLTQSDVIKQIMTILIIGLIIDIINTWIQNSGILIWYDQFKSNKK
jgi:preprotein translocase subunit SecF